MIRARVAVLAGAMFAAGAAQQAQGYPQAPAAPNPPAQAETPAATLPNGTAVNAVLSSSVDSKKAKVGDKVEARTTDAMLEDGKEMVPKGAKLEGHVTEATARSKGDNGSTLAMQFDRAIPKKGGEIPLNVLIVAVAPPENDLSGGSAGPGNDPMSNRGAAAAGGSPMGSARSQNPTSTTPTYPSAGSAGSPSDSPATSGPGQLPANSRGVYGLRDLKLMMSNSGTSQTTVLTSTGKNVHLDGGTRLLLVGQAQTAAAAIH